MVFAVLKDEKDELADIFDAVRIALYDQEKSWEEREAFYFTKMNAESLLAVRQFGEYITSQLKEKKCNMLLGKKIVGIPFQILEKNEIIMCEIEDVNHQILDIIYDDFYCKIPEKKEYTPKVPSKTDKDGFYYFDFVACQKQFPEVTSKQALLPFLNNEIFICLTLECNHIMPWLSGYAKEHGLEVLEETVKEGCRLHIRHQECA